MTFTGTAQVSLSSIRFFVKNWNEVLKECLEEIGQISRGLRDISGS